MKIEDVPTDMWATVPLLDPSNVGKYVMSAWNGNWSTMAGASMITKIGRTNIHTDDGNSYNVDGHHGRGSSGRHYVAMSSRSWFLQRHRRAQLATRLNSSVRFNDSMDPELLEAAAALFNIDISDIES